MSDQCRNCTLRGMSIERCADKKETDCSIPESWYARELEAALKAATERAEKAEAKA